MAKADFCFNYYDGDATRDMAHMNRLERGAYTDVVIQQRQRGHLSLDDLKKFLSRDFEAVWPSLEWVLKVDSDGKFFIEWLENSEVKSKAHSTKQTENRAKAEEKKKNSDQTLTKNTSGQPLVEPLGDGNGDEYVIENNKKESVFDFEFRAAFDDRTREAYERNYKHKGIDIEEQLRSFRLKCDNDRGSYYTRSSSTLRTNFQYQLDHARNGHKEGLSLGDRKAQERKNKLGI